MVSKPELELSLIAWTYIPDETKKRVESMLNFLISQLGGFNKFCDQAWRFHHDKVHRNLNGQ